MGVINDTEKNTRSTSSVMPAAIWGAAPANDPTKNRKENMPPLMRPWSLMMAKL